MLGRVKEVVADAAETLRRAFAGLRVFEAAPEAFHPQSLGWQPAESAGSEGLQPLGAQTQALPLLGEAVEGRRMEAFQPKLISEAGWEAWGAEATVLRMAPLEAGRAAGVAVPALPQTATPAGSLPALGRPATRRHEEPLRTPGSRRLEIALEPSRALPGVQAILRQPVPVLGESPQRLPKGLWMRYSLELVRRTGENVRNLEVIGLYRIPRKGVGDLRHDSKTDRILLRLDEAALRAPREAFILARRKDDGALISSFVEGS